MFQQEKSPKVMISQKAKYLVFQQRKYTFQKIEIYTHLIRTILICTFHSTKEVDISDGMDISLADLPSVFSSEHNSGGRSVAADGQQQAGNMKQALSGIEEIKSNLKKSSAGTGSGTISTTIKVDTISIDSDMYKKDMP